MRHFILGFSKFKTFLFSFRFFFFFLTDEKVAGDIAGCWCFLTTLLSMLKKSFIEQALGINVYQ